MKQLYEERAVKKGESILVLPSHPLNHPFEILPLEEDLIYFF